MLKIISTMANSELSQTQIASEGIQFGCGNGVNTNTSWIAQERTEELKVIIERIILPDMWMGWRKLEYIHRFASLK